MIKRPPVTLCTLSVLVFLLTAVFFSNTGRAEDAANSPQSTGQVYDGIPPFYELGWIWDPETGQDIQLVIDEPKDAFIGNREAPIYDTPLLEGEPVAVIPEGTHVILNSYAGGNRGFLVYELSFDDTVGYIRSDYVLYLEGAIKEDGFLKIPGGTAGYEGWSQLLYASWLLTQSGEYHYIGVQSTLCGTEDAYWSPGKKYFYTNLMEIAPRFFDNPMTSRIISSNGETVFEEEYRLDSPCWVDDNTVYLTEAGYSDSVYRFRIDNRELKKIASYPGKSIIPEMGGGDCFHPNRTAMFDKESNNVTATFIRQFGIGILVTVDESGNILSTKKVDSVIYGE